MCLLENNDEPCPHSECRLIMKIRSLNPHVFENAQSKRDKNVPTFQTLNNLEFPEKKGSQDGESPLTPSIQPKKVKVEQNGYHLEEENPEKLSETVLEMTERMNNLKKTVNAIKMALERNNIVVDGI